jgi:hypothetical protein
LFGTSILYLYLYLSAKLTMLLICSLVLVSSAWPDQLPAVQKLVRAKCVHCPVGFADVLPGNVKVIGKFLEAQHFSMSIFVGPKTIGVYRKWSEKVEMAKMGLSVQVDMCLEMVARTPSCVIGNLH